MRLIILAGLPGVGKSHTARILEQHLPDAKHFDSDLFSKQRLEREGVDHERFSDEERYAYRLASHREKAEAIMDAFEEHETLIVDTCFDVPETRPYLTDLRERWVEVVIVELVCSQETARERILEREHESHRMIGDPQGRWRMYELMRERWIPIEEEHVTIKTDRDYEKQLEALIDTFK